MKNPIVFYVFRRPINQALKLAKEGKYPNDIFYGFTTVKRFNLIYSDKVFNNKLLILSQNILNYFISFIYGGGFSIIPTISIINLLNKSDLIFTTVDTYGLPIAFLKSLGIIKPKIILNTIGLYDGLIKYHNSFALFFIKKITRHIEYFISGGSFQECKKLSTILNIPINKFTFIPFGIDCKYFKKHTDYDNQEILTIGSDYFRNWDLMAQVIKAFPNEKFRIVTMKGLVKLPIPSNAVFEYNISYEAIRERIWQAKFILLLTKKNHYFSGQSTAFRSMSCGKPVIFTRTPGVNEYKFKNYKQCIIVPPNNLLSIIKAIKYLNKSKKIRSEMGIQASDLIKKEYNINSYSEKLQQIFKKIITLNN